MDTVHFSLSERVIGKHLVLRAGLRIRWQEVEMADLISSLCVLSSRTKRIVEFHRNTLKAGKEKMDTIEFLESRQRLLEKYWEQLDAQYEITLLLTQNVEEMPAYFSENEFELTESAYTDAMSFIEARLNVLHPVVANERRPEAAAAVVKVKPIEPPTFNGDIVQWKSFADLFRAIIINNTSLQ